MIQADTDNVNNILQIRLVSCINQSNAVTLKLSFFNGSFLINPLSMMRELQFITMLVPNLI